MKIFNIVLVVSIYLLQSLYGHEECYSCDIGNIYHHGSYKLCLRKSPELSGEEITHIIKHHLKKQVTEMDLSDQPNLTDRHLKRIAQSPCAKRVISIDLYNCQKVTYDGIRALWESETLGSYRKDDPVYYRYDNTPISVVRLEIGETKAVKQYQRLRTPEGRKIFPLPIRPDFTIKYTCSCGRHILKTVEDGYKAIAIYIDDERVKKN